MSLYCFQMMISIENVKCLYVRWSASRDSQGEKQCTLDLMWMFGVWLYLKFHFLLSKGKLLQPLDPVNKTLERSNVFEI